MENAEMRAENICYKEPVNFQNEEKILQAMIEEENCIATHVQKFLPKQSRRTEESKAHDICTMRIFDKDFKLNKR